MAAFTRPKAGREVGPLNWTQGTKAFDTVTNEGYGPRPRPARDWPVPKSDLRPARRRERELGPQAIGDFLKTAILHRFPDFYTLTFGIFPDVFYPFPSNYYPCEPWKVSWKSVRTFLRNPEDIHIDRQTSGTDTPMILNCRYHAYCIIVSDISPKLDALGNISVAVCLRLSSTTFTQCAPESTELGNIKAISPFKVIQGHRCWYQSNVHIRLPISD